MHHSNSSSSQSKEVFFWQAMQTCLASGFSCLCACLVASIEERERQQRASESERCESEWCRSLLGWFVWVQTGINDREVPVTRA